MTASTSPAPRSLHVLDGGAWAGMEVQVLHLLRAALAAGAPMQVALASPAPAAARYRAIGAEVEVLPPGRVAALRRLAARVRTERPDVVHVHGYLGTLLGAPVAARTRVALVSTLHGAIDPGRSPLRRIWWLSRGAKRLALALGARFLAVSEQTARDWASEGVPRDRIRVVHNGIVAPPLDDATLARRGRGAVAGGRFRLGVVGRFAPVKDYALFLEAGARILAAREDAELVLVGDGPLHAALAARARELGIAGRTRFTGFLADPLPEVAALDALFVTSRSEGIPYSLLEALALGVPVVSVCVGGLPEVLVHEANALLAGTRDADALARAGLRLLGDAALRERLARGARATATGAFSAETMLARTLDVQQHAISAQSRRAPHR